MKRPGFTLMELLVVAAVFSILFLIGTGVYTNAFGKQKVVQSKQRVASEARSALETIARTVRVGNIDYAYYRTGCGGAACDLSLPQSIIAVRDTSGAQTCFTVNATQQLVTTTTCTNPIASWTVMTPDDLRINGFVGWILPWADPFLGPATKDSDCKVNPHDDVNGLGYDKSSGVCRCQNDTQCAQGQTCDSTAHICKNPNAQPMVTVRFTMQTLPTAPYPAVSQVQTSIVTRNYQR